MIAKWFIEQPRLVIMATVIIAVAGITSFQSLPRMEDPVLTARFAMVTTPFPGATSERVEALVAKKIEQELSDITEIHEITTVSRSGICVSIIELDERLKKDRVATAWGIIRERLNSAHVNMPPAVARPRLKEIDAKANALLASLTWKQDDAPSYSVLRRLAKRLQDRIDRVEGTEKTDLYGDPQEEFLVQVEGDELKRYGIDSNVISQIINTHDTKLPAGRIQGARNNLSLEVSGSLDSKTQLGLIPILQDGLGGTVELRDIANIERTIPDPAPAVAFVGGKPAIVVGAQLEDDFRIDVWRSAIQSELKSFEAELPDGIDLEIIFDQTPYVEARLVELKDNFLLGLISVIVCTILWMDLRSGLLVGMILPFTCLMILPIMLVMGIPLHQMSLSGLVLSMGLLVDNAIVVVDHIEHEVSKGKALRTAVRETPQFVFVSLLGSTLTTVFSFAPIALMPGATGEFVGSIAVVTIITVLCSLFISLTIIPAFSQLWIRPRRHSYNRLTNPFRLSEKFYKWVLAALLRFPIGGALLLSILAGAGFLGFVTLQDQFFPPAERDQFHVELELPASSSLSETKRVAEEIRLIALADPAIKDVHWFLGASAPTFYYNAITVRSNQPSYGQAMVICKSAREARPAMLRLQSEVNKRFPLAHCAVRQLEQGPPFSAPIELRLSGPDVERLREIGSELRYVLSQTPGVTHTRSEVDEISAKGIVSIDPVTARLAGQNLTSVSAKLNSSLDGEIGGTILEGTEEIPVRVRYTSANRADLNEVLSMEIDGEMTPGGMMPSRPTLDTISKLSLAQDSSAITRINKQRCNEIQAFIPAGELPSTVLSRFKENLKQSNFALPEGYSMKYLGASGEQQQALGNLVVYGSVLATALVATLVLSLNSFRLAGLVFYLSLMSVGFSVLSLSVLNLPFGFMAILGIVGMMGVVVNDSILIISAIRRDHKACSGDIHALIQVMFENSRHVLVTSITTVAGFLPLYLNGGDFWPPTAVCVSAGVAGSTFMALFFIPCGYVVLSRLFGKFSPQQ
ncbi:MAG: efflux RND transporter permease subunit [Pirellula sp.]|jgi:multidrug efflux pump subunit AcrB|nr:efflux RND transporter permease subunit [Pirellula sp.]